ncbi:MAG: SPOR domain-containing protein [Calditrichaeota bacterium]|nr:SPOR domain-containing protein [Calditrichota bacterium]
MPVLRRACCRTPSLVAAGHQTLALVIRICHWHLAKDAQATILWTMKNGLISPRLQLHGAAWICFWALAIGCVGTAPQAEFDPKGGLPPSDSTAPSWPPRQREDLPRVVLPERAFYAPTPRLDFRPYRFAYAVMPADTMEAEDAPLPLPELRDGYRVQVFSGYDQSLARRAESSIREMTGLPTYMLYEAPQYKVRVGEFPTREGAVNLCDSLRRSGFPDAWVVRSTISLFPTTNSLQSTAEKSP